MFNLGFSLTFIGAFLSDEEYYGKDIIEGLSKICQETNQQKFFTSYVRIKKKTELVPNSFRVNQEFTSDFFK